jgi:membrane dipeptidase
VTPRIIDFHNDTIVRVIDHGVDLSVRRDDGQVDLPRLLEGGVGCSVFACFASRLDHGDRVAERADRMLDAVAALERFERVAIPRTAEDLAALRDDRSKIGVLPAVECGEALDARLERLERFKRRGVVYMTLAWTDNELAGAAFGDTRGLTELGREVVREMERLDILVDVSHMSDAAVADTLGTAKRTVIASHSNCRALCGSPRNLTDDQIRAISERGGVIGISFVPGFLADRTREAENPIMQRIISRAKESPGGLTAAMHAARAELGEVPLPNADAIVDHVDHLAEVGGVGCVAFGSDLDGVLYTPSDVRDCTAFPLLLRKLRERGFTTDDLRRICWDNWSRVLASTFPR